MCYLGRWSVVMATEKFTTAEVIEALERFQGIKALAAEALGCDRHTVDNYIKRHPTVALAYDDLRETMVDRAERGLLKLLVAEDWQAIKYVLSTLGKDRGYSERQEITGPEGGPLQVEHDLDAETIAEALRILGGDGSRPGSGS